MTTTTIPSRRHLIPARATADLRHILTVMYATGATCAKFDRAPGLYMAWHVEKIGVNLVSLAHYGEQNGDAMRDPDLVLAQTAEGFIPVSFRNDYAGVYQDFTTEEEGEYTGCLMQASAADFCREWFANLRDQQGIHEIPQIMAAMQAEGVDA